MDGPNIIADLLFKEECYRIVGLAMKVHSILGKGFKEVVYKDALEIEFKKNQIQYERERRFKIKYKGATLAHRFDADFLVYDSIVIEVKATQFFHYKDFEQTLNYLKASKVKFGILINFGESQLKFKRVVCSY